MHWAMAICLLLILITIFLRLTWMEKNHVASIIKEFLAGTDQQLSDEQLIVLAKKIRKPMWDWHVNLGYVMVGLYSIRFALPFFGQMRLRKPFQKGLSLQTKIQYWAYLIFYLCLAVSLITGLMIDQGPKDLKHTMEEIHELSIYYLLAFIVIHLGGVLTAEFTNDKGIISRVISGGKKDQQQ